MLTKKHVKDVCLIGQGHLQCRYLEEARGGRCLCLKHTRERSVHDEMVEEYIEQWTQIGLDPTRGSTPIGNNCKGYPYFQDLPQGYDLEP